MDSDCPCKKNKKSKVKMPYDITFRYNRDKGNVPYGISCTVTIGDHMLLDAIARCNPIDNFNKSTGRKVSFTRAIASFPKNIRTALWEKFHDKEWHGEVFV